MYRRYGFIGSFRLIISLIYTKIVYPKARLIRFPFDIRNKKYIKIGRNFTTGFGCRVEAFPEDDRAEFCITIGENVQINDYVHIGAIGSITIGDNVLMASKIYISDHNHGSYDLFHSDSPLIIPSERKAICKPVVIENNVWLGESVCILPGVIVGEGSIVGALSVVTKNIPAYCIAAGSPAKIIKKYNFETNFWEKYEY